ncbi:unnamed protein product [Caretta caretta]
MDPPASTVPYARLQLPDLDSVPSATSCAAACPWGWSRSGTGGGVPSTQRYRRSKGRLGHRKNHQHPRCGGRVGMHWCDHILYDPES